MLTESEKYQIKREDKKQIIIDKVTGYNKDQITSFGKIIKQSLKSCEEFEEYEDTARILQIQK